MLFRTADAKFTAKNTKFTFLSKSDTNIAAISRGTSSNLAREIKNKERIDMNRFEKVVRLFNKEDA